MKRSQKTLLLLLAALLCACAPLQGETPARPEEQLVVGVVVHMSESSWRDRLHESLENSALKRNIQLIQIETERTQDSQIQAMRALITYQVDAIVVSPLVQRGWDNVLREAKAAEIPVLMVHRNVQTEETDVVAAYIGADYERQGELAARFIQERTRQSAGPHLIMELHGTVGASDTVERSRGMRRVFGQSEAYEIYATISCNFMYSWARESMRAHLKSGRMPDIVISYSDNMTLGVIAAMEEEGVVPGRDILILSFDAQQDAMALLAEGKINCIIENEPDVGEQVMDAVCALAAGETVQNTYLPSELFRETDDLSAFAPRGY